MVNETGFDFNDQIISLENRIQQAVAKSIFSLGFIQIWSTLETLMSL